MLVRLLIMELATFLQEILGHMEDEDLSSMTYTSIGERMP